MLRVRGDEACDHLVIDVARCFATISIDAIAGSNKTRCGRLEGHERQLRAAAAAGSLQTSTSSAMSPTRRVGATELADCAGSPA
jgi:hypothetical protein